MMLRRVADNNATNFDSTPTSYGQLYILSPTYGTTIGEGHLNDGDKIVLQTVQTSLLALIESQHSGLFVLRQSDPMQSRVAAAYHEGKR